MARATSESAVSSFRANSPWLPLAFTWFRWLWIASIVSNIGTWMQNVGAAWAMTTMAPSALLVALVQTATNLPVFLLGVLAGAIGDIVDRRKLLLITQGWMLLAAAVLGALTIAGHSGPWILLWLTFALGLGATMNGPAWQAIMPELVPKAELPAAIALNSMGFNVARAVGPALGGLVVAAIGAGAAFILNAISFIAVLIVLYFWKRAPEHSPDSTETVMTAIWAGMRYVRFAPTMQSVLLRSGTFVISASAIWSLLPLVAKVELHRESSGFGVLLGCLGAGSILGALVIGRLRQLFSPEVIVTSAVVMFGLANIALAYLESFAAVAIVLLTGGVAWMFANSSLNTAAQTSVPAWVRARAMALYLLGFQGSMAIGSVIWGEVASRFGLRTTLLVAGIALGVAAAATVRLRLSASEHLDVSPSLHLPDPTLAIERSPEHGPVLVTVEYAIEPQRHAEFARAMDALRTIRRRDGAVRWGLFEDAAIPGKYIETFVVDSWAEHLRQHERMTIADRDAEAAARVFHIGSEPPKVTHWIAARE
ncbi:MAG TPA: MFS transporter [Bryobacteraceae bacterium]|nr:MFS transporter [Bryobacteraceae bacterium]